jgi:hypothetical protein
VDGKRTVGGSPASLNVATSRQRTHEYGERSKSRLPVYVKPARRGMNGKGMTAMDRTRVIGRACYDAAPYANVDVKLCYQSI